MNFPGVIERTENCGTDSLHIPEMKEFMGNRRKNLPVTGLRHEIVLANGDPSGVQMFDTIRGLWLNFEQKYVFFVWKLSENRHGRFHDVLNVRCNLRRTHRNIWFTDYEMMTCTACLALQELEFTSAKCRPICENVVVGGVGTVASSLQARI